MTENVFPKGIGNVLFPSETNNLFKRTALYNQTINVGVSVGNMVYFDGTEWLVATDKNAVGLYADNSVVVTRGYVSGLTGLTVGDWYGKNSVGTLTNIFTSADQCIGNAISTTELVVLLGGVNAYG